MARQFTRLTLGAAIPIAALAGSVPGSFAQMNGPLMFQGHEMMSADDMTTMLGRMRNAKTASLA